MINHSVSRGLQNSQHHWARLCCYDGGIGVLEMDDRRDAECVAGWHGGLYLRECLCCCRRCLGRCHLTTD